MIIESNENIVIDIMRHNELIPHKGVVGGKMGFYDAKEIYILSNKWVFASFDDGHLSGKMLLEYNVSDKGTISWKVISSYLN